jgi:tetratricopeptide (TPR) repeat protein
MLNLKNTLVTALLITCSFLQAQTKKEKRQLKKSLKEAQVFFYAEDYYSAWEEYRKALAIDKKNDLASVNGVICAFKLNYPVDSVADLSSNLADSKFEDAKFYLGKIKHLQRSFDKAIALFQEYNDLNPVNRLHDFEETEYMINVCKNAKLFTFKPHKSIITNMSAEINSPYSDYVPVILPDESALYFTSRRPGSSNNKKDAYNNFYEDVYVSYKEGDTWKKAENVGSPINSETNDACVAISPNGQRMIVYRTSSSDQSTGDLYLTKLRANNTWGPVEKIGNEINSQYIETSACFSNDTTEIYFSSNRPGGYGGKDIYRIKKTPNGSWALPYNLGPAINSSRDDDAPFLHPDGITLYFSSQGHNTMGGFDVFKSKLNTETNQFSKAENLGYPINDVGNDIFFVLSVDGQRGYYSSVKDQTFGGNDIYQIDTRFGDNDLKVKQGVAFLDDAPGRVAITLYDNEGNQVNGNYYSNAANGKFILVMNPLKSYKAVIEAAGYKKLEVNLVPLAQEKSNQDLAFKLEKQ